MSQVICLRQRGSDIFDAREDHVWGKSTTWSTSSATRPLMSYSANNSSIMFMIGTTSAGEGRLTYWRQHDRLVTTNSKVNTTTRQNTKRNQNSQLRRGRTRNVTKTVNSDEAE